jgi:hypothetical protein
MGQAELVGAASGGVIAGVLSAGGVGEVGQLPWLEHLTSVAQACGTRKEWLDSSRAGSMIPSPTRGTQSKRFRDAEMGELPEQMLGYYNEAEERLRSGASRRAVQPSDSGGDAARLGHLPSHATSFHDGLCSVR